MFLQLLASHRQSQTTLHEAAAWAKNAFQKRALEKHLLAGACGHIFLRFPLLARSPSRALGVVKGQGTGKTVWLPHSCRCLLHLTAAATWWSLVLLPDGSPAPADPRLWDELEPSPSFPQPPARQQELPSSREPGSPASTITAAGGNLEVTPDVSQLLSFPLSLSRGFELLKKLSLVTARK